MKNDINTFLKEASAVSGVDPKEIRKPETKEELLAKPTDPAGFKKDQAAAAKAKKAQEEVDEDQVEVLPEAAEEGEIPEVTVEDDGDEEIEK